MPTYDPGALLNPKGLAKQAREARQKEEAQKRANFKDELVVRNDGTSDLPDPEPQAIGMGSFIERQHRPEERSNQKRVKRAKQENDEGESDIEVRNSKHHKGASVRGASGVWAGHQEEMKKKYQQNGPPAVIDLTNDVAGDSDYAAHLKERQKEVCLGMIQDAFINAHKVPTPKSTGFQGTDKMWQPMKVELRRRLAGSHNTAISAFDPQGRNFGTVDPRIAQVLAPLMDASASNKVRVSARLNVRKRKPYELPGKETSEKLSATITVYSPLNQVKGIGQRFSQANLWLRHPIASDRGIDIVNPHEPTNFAPKAIKAAPSYKRPGGGEQRIIQRTAEEIREDVCHIFDSLKDSATLPEMEPCELIVTPLLSHQKQALHFLTQRETDNRQPKPLDASQNGDDGNQSVNGSIIDITEDEDELSLWIERRRRNGNIAWYHAITGHEITHRPAPVLGGILADVMGLGKTLNILSLICGTLDEARKFGHEDPPVEGDSGIKVNSKATLIIAPLSTVSNWEDQIRAHVKKRSLRVTVHHGMKRTNNPEDLCNYDVVITTYSVVSADADKRSRSRPNDPLGEVNWFRIVLDEAHSIREQSTRQSKAVCALTAQRRWAVTGTPVQNRLDDLGALIKFLHIEPFDEPGNFAQYIIAPFKVADVEILPKLRVLVDSITLRRGKDKVNLPSREEQIIWLPMSDSERSLYHFFEKDSHAKMRAIFFNKDKVRGRNTVANVLRTILRLRMLCAHGAEMLSDEDLDASRGLTMNTAIDLEEETEKSDLSPREAYRTFRMLRDAQANDCCLCGKWVQPPNEAEVDSSSAAHSSDNSDAEGANDDEVSDTEHESVHDSTDKSRHAAEEAAAPQESTDYDKDGKDTFGYMTSCNHLLCLNCLAEFRRKQWDQAYADGYANCIDCGFYIRISFFTLRTQELLDDERSAAEIKRNPKLARANGTYNGPHTKTKWLVESLQTERAMWLSQYPDSSEPPIKSVIFSGWTTHLDLIQIALTEAHITFTRLDGSMTRSARTAALHNFEHNYDVQCILVSIGAGGLGLNLTAASRVYLMEPQFNPAAEDQAIERVHRLGQKRDVIIYKLMMQDSFEGKIMELQKRKRRLAQMSLERRESGMFEERGSAKQSLEDLKALFR